MALSKSKNILLNTQLNLLGLGGAFNNWFFYEGRMAQPDVITLQEFISLNSSLRVSGEQFITWKNDDAKKAIQYRRFTSDNKSWEKLKTLLLKNGFTYKDWIMLLPQIDTQYGKKLNFSLLEKAQLLDIPLYRLTFIKPSCSPFWHISYFIFKEQVDIAKLTVKHILALDGKATEKLLQDHYDRRRIEKTLLSIQKSLSGYSLTEKDGPFMKLNLPYTKSKEDYIEDLMKNKQFSKKDAALAVDLGLKAGWIEV